MSVLTPGSRWGKVVYDSYARPLLTVNLHELIICAGGEWQEGSSFFFHHSDMDLTTMPLAYDNIFVVPVQTDGSEEGVDHLKG